MAKKKSSMPRKYTIGITVTLILLIIFILSIIFHDRYKYIENIIFPIWYVALILGVVAGLLFVLYFTQKEISIAAKIGAFLLITAISFFGFGTVLSHINHFFDYNEPQVYTSFIEEKDTHRRTGKYGKTRYEFTLTVDGNTFDINVPSYDYYKYDMGDLYVVEYHKGAFNEPYYIGIGGVDE